MRFLSTSIRIHCLLSAFLTLLSAAPIAAAAAAHRLATEEEFNNDNSDVFPSSRELNNSNNNGNNVNHEDDPVRVIFKYKNDRGRSEAAIIGKMNIDIPRFSIASISTIRRNIKALENNPNIESVEIDKELHLLDVVPPSASSEEEENNPSLRGRRDLVENIPYGINMVQADLLNLPPVSTSNPKIKVCIVDTGYDSAHEDLPSTNVAGFVPSDSFYSGQKWNTDGNGHGSFVTGIIGAVGGNGKGVKSILSDPNKFIVFVAKGLTDSGSATTSGIFSAVDFCVTYGAKVINLSVGGSGYSSTANAFYRDIYNQHDVLLIAPAGNSGNSALYYPASYTSVISVASVGSNELRSSFSQYNDQVELAAPGSNIPSSIPGNGYAYKSGTNFAAPYVAGVAALVWSHFPQCTNKQIRGVLFKTAKDKGSTGCDTYYGGGIVQAKNAYNLLLAQGCGAGDFVDELYYGDYNGCYGLSGNEEWPGTDEPDTDNSTPAPISPPTPAPISPPTPAPISPPTPAPISPPTPAPIPDPNEGFDVSIGTFGGGAP